MAKYKVTGPDGSAYNVTAPDDATPEQITSYVKSNYQTAGKPKEPQPNELPKREFGSLSSIAEDLKGNPYPMKDMNLKNVGEAARKAAIKTAQFAVPTLALEGAGPLVKTAAPKLAEVAKDVKSGIKSTPLDRLEPIYKEMKRVAGESMKKAFGDNPIINKAAASRIAQKVEDAVAAKGLNNEKLHGATLSAVRDLKKAAEKDMSLAQLEQHRQLLRDVIRKDTTKLEGAGVEVPKASAAIDAIDDGLMNINHGDLTTYGGYGHVKKVGDLESVRHLEDYRKQYAAAKRFERIADLARKAKGNATEIRKGAAKLSEKDRFMAGHTPEEKAAIKKLGTSSITDRTLAGIGKLGFDPSKAAAGGLVPMAETIGAVSNPALIAPIGGGTLSNLFRNYQTRGQLENLLNMIKQGQNAQK